ncbi:MAG TPA: amidase family protein, partial [Burkholderiales bacterium]|nr:amidase family protein [Burkholderiales bacterium]
MHNATIKSLAAALAARTISSVELTRHFINRINGLNEKYHCFITLDPEASLKQAAAADRMLAGGRGQPLTGIPIAQKDIFCAKGWLTTCGSKMLSNFTAPYDAHVVEQLNAAGAVILGKTNMDEFAMGSSSETSHYGPVRNPWDVDTVPGGSSGGSAAAVAARLSPGATGTDTGGSIRQPAALSGICGLKPTYGVVSRYGMIAFASSLDQGGPLARSAEDLALLMNVMAGHDERDSTSLQREREDYTRELGKPVKGLKIGLPEEFFAKGAAPEVVRAVEAAVAEFRKLGAETVELSLPNMKLSVPVYYVLAPAE